MKHSPALNALNPPLPNSSFIPENYLPTKIYEKCPNAEGLWLVNINTGEYHEANCKSYSCPFCSVKKKQRLYSALQGYLSQFHNIKLFTFTIRSSLFPSPELSVKPSSEIWRRFINNVRRSKLLSFEEKNFDYVRVSEYTKKGFVHFHVIIHTFLPLKIINGIWWDAINQVCHTRGRHGNIDISKRKHTAKSSASYVCKYVLKSAVVCYLKHRLYSKSKSCVLFKKKESTHEWIFVNARHSPLDLEALSFSSQLRKTEKEKEKNFTEFLLNEFKDGDITLQIIVNSS
jgi:hypothetical protein